MSYILDALKKIEQEKSRKAHPDGRISISGDLFQERKRPASRTGIWKILALVAVASLVTSAGTWFALQGKAKKSPAVVQHPVSSGPPAAVVRLPHAPKLIQQSLPAPAVATPVGPVNSAAVTVATPVVRSARIHKEKVPPSSPTRSTAKTKHKTITKSRMKTKTGTRTKTETPKQTVQTVPAPADIKLSGIAWQDKRSLRRAVINGFLLKEGAIVSGSRIIDIQSDRVRFSSPSGVFDIKLDSVPPAEVKQ